MKNKPNIILGIIVLLFGLALLLILIPKGIETSPYNLRGERIGPDFFPTVVAVGSILIGVLLIVSSWIGAEKTKVDTNLPGNIVLAMLLFILYAVLIVPLGYLISTMLALAGLLVVFGERRKPFLVGLPLGIAILFQLIFAGLFKVLLPGGILF